MPKFKPGDMIVESYGKKEIRKIVFIIDENRYVEGPWSFKKSVFVGENSYVLETVQSEFQKIGVWTFDSCDLIEEVFELLEEQSWPLCSDMYPHTCPRCGAPAYIGMNDIECSHCGRF